VRMLHPIRVSTAMVVMVALTQTGLAAQRRVAETSVNRTTRVNRDEHVNVNRTTNVNVNRDVNVNVHRDVDVNVDRRYYGVGCCYDPHPIATAAAVTTAAVVTAAVIGSVVHSLPPSCSVVVVGGISYQHCGATWYQPRFAASSVTYVVVTAPR
jgi:hypothetical protein